MQIRFQGLQQASQKLGVKTWCKYGRDRPKGEQNQNMGSPLTLRACNNGVAGH